ncbi:hypothetical protein BRADI_3g20645v3 [Brachypodium distachyon]|uniref:Uncharacterized protein n=1 Tax=Brachypodium distachyon TaxID=15368 RepID=A0A0Q3FCW8_BRADI|nr:hypothetical protein BRADI_3g20645v3 [Brachypodium distachyon]
MDAPSSFPSPDGHTPSISFPRMAPPPPAHPLEASTPPPPPFLSAQLIGIHPSDAIELGSDKKRTEEII